MKKITRGILNYYGDNVWVALFLLFIVIILSYSNAVQGHFMMDDHAYILNKQFTPPINEVANVFLQDSNNVFYRPMCRLYNTITYHFFQTNHWRYRLFNIFLFILNGALIFTFIRQLLGKYSLALLTTILYCVHPIHNIAVNYVALPLVPFSICFFLSLILFFHYKKSQSNWIIMGASLFLFFVGILFHEVAILLPVYLFIILLYWKKEPLPNVFKSVLPYLIVGLCYIFLRLYFIDTTMEAIGMVAHNVNKYHLDIFEIISVVIRISSIYCSKLILPLNILGMWHIKPVAGFAAAWILGAVTFVAAVGILFRRLGDGRPATLFLFWFLLGFLPLGFTSFIYPASEATIEPHWFLFSSVGFFAILSIGLIKLKSVLTKKLWMLILCGIIAGSITLTRINNQIWQNEMVPLKGNSIKLLVK